MYILTIFSRVTREWHEEFVQKIACHTHVKVKFIMVGGFCNKANCIQGRRRGVSRGFRKPDNINVNGVEKLLAGLQGHKAHGPDGIPARLLKVCS